MTPFEELEDAAAALLDASHTEERQRFSGAPVWTRFAEEGYFARLANAVRRVRGERDGDPQSAIEAAMRTGDTECPSERGRGRCRCGATFDIETGICNRTGILAMFCDG